MSDDKEKYRKALLQLRDGLLLSDGINHDDNSLRELAYRCDNDYISIQLFKLDEIVREALS